MDLEQFTAGLAESSTPALHGSLVIDAHLGPLVAHGCLLVYPLKSPDLNKYRPQMATSTCLGRHFWGFGGNFRQSTFVFVVKTVCCD